MGTFNHADASGSGSERPYLSLVLPCYNEGQVIRETHRRVTTVCRDLGKDYEILVVNDGSSDNTGGSSGD